MLDGSWNFRTLVDCAGAWACGVFIAILPWQVRFLFLLDPLGERSDFYKGGLYLFDCVFFVMVALWWCGMLLDWKERVRPRVPVNAMVYVLALPTCIGIFHLFRMDAVSLYWIFRLYEAVLVAICFCYFRPRLRVLVLIFIFSVAVSSALGVWQFASQYVEGSSLFGIAPQSPFTPGVSVVENSGGRFLRAYGGMSHPNILGGFTIVAIVLGGYLLLTVQQPALRRMGRVGLFVMLGVCTVGLVLSASRGAILSAFGIWCGALLFAPRRARVSAGVFGIFLVILIILVSNPFLFSRFAGSGRLEYQSYTDRIGSMAIYQSIIRDNWIVGTGVGQYTQEVFERTGAPFPQPVHSIFLIIFAELGVFPCLGVLLWFGYGMWRVYAQRMFSLRTATPVLIVFVGTGAVDHYWWTYPSGFLVVFVVSSMCFLLSFDKNMPAMVRLNED